MPAPSSSRFASLLIRFSLGLLIGCFLHYILYRLALPLHPFIYVMF